MVLNAALGCVVGLILALTGAGGGILAVPLLMFGAGLGAAQAAPIGLMAVGMSAACGALLGMRAGVVRYKAALLMAACGASCAPLGVRLSQSVDNRSLTLVFALVLAGVAIRILCRGASVTVDEVRRRPAPCMRNDNSGKLVWTSPCARALLATAAATGLCTGLLGVGGGFVMVPALRRATNLAMESIVATSLAVIALVAFVTVTSSAASGQLDWGIALPFGIGAVCGMLGGRLVSTRAGGGRLQQSAFAWLALGAAIALLFKTSLFNLFTGT